MISIHLRRTGAKKDAHYRVVVADSRAARDGAFIEILGHYHPRYEPAKVVLDVEKTKAWIDKGAQASDTVKSLLKKVESGALETERPVAPSRRREAIKQATTRAAAPEPEPEVEVEPEVEAAPVDEDGGAKAEATTDEPAAETAADEAAGDADAAPEAAEDGAADDVTSDDAEAEVAAAASSDDAVASESGDAETAAEEDDEQANK